MPALAEAVEVLLLARALLSRAEVVRPAAVAEQLVLALAGLLELLRPQQQAGALAQPAEPRVLLLAPVEAGLLELVLSPLLAPVLLLVQAPRLPLRPAVPR